MNKKTSVKMLLNKTDDNVQKKSPNSKDIFFLNFAFIYSYNRLYSFHHLSCMLDNSIVFIFLVLTFSLSNECAQFYKFSSCVSQKIINQHCFAHKMNIFPCIFCFLSRFSHFSSFLLACTCVLFCLLSKIFFR